MSSLNWDWPHTKKWPRFSGERVDIVKQLFLAGEAMNVDNFVKFFTADALYQFGNAAPVHGPEGIRKSSGSFQDKGSFLGKVEGLHHHIKNVWEVAPDALVVEMDVTYVRHDGRVITLPCCDVIRFSGDQVAELRIHMDISPVLGD
jgi:hypothetical protein